MNESNASPVVRSRREIRVNLIVSCLMVINPFATDMYLSSLPEIARQFHSTAAQAQGTLSGFVLGMALGQLLFGPLADRFGRRWPLLAGFSLFTLMSLLIPYAPDMRALVALRFLQGMGSCAGGAVGRAVLRDLFSGHRLTHAISVQMMIQSIGPILAPLVGAYVYALAGWRANFFLMAVFGILCVLLIAIGLPETLDPADRRTAHPLATLRIFRSLLRQRDFLLPLVTSAAAMSALFSYLSCSPYVLLNAYHVTVRQFGWIFGAVAIAGVLAGQGNRLLVRRFTAMNILSAITPASAGLGLLLILAASTHQLAWLLPPLTLFMTTLPLTAANATALAMQPTAGIAGTASSLLGVLQWSCASLISVAAVSFPNGSAYPMSVTMTLCVLAGGVAFLAWRRRHRG